MTAARLTVRLLLVAPSMALLTACAFKGPRAPEVTPPPAYEAPAGAPLAEETLDRWWTAFNDPALTSLVEDALARSPAARSAAQRLLEARASRDSQVAQTFPRGNIAGNGSLRQTEDLGSNSSALFPTGGRTESETLNFNVSWEIDLFGRLSAARRVADADLAAVRFNSEGARAALAASVADSYFAARGLAIQLADARQTARIQGQIRDIARIKLERGLSPASDLDRVSGDLAQAEAQVTSLEAELHAAQRTLLVLVGRGFEPTDNLPVEAAAPDSPPVPAALPGDLLARRPDVREAEARLVSSVGRQRLANLALFPSFTINPGVGLSRSVAPGVTFSSGTITPTTTTTQTGFWSAGVGVTIPVLDIPKLMADIRAQDARTEQAVLAYEKSVQTAYGEADNALVRLAADQRRIAQLSAGEQRAARALAAARTRYEAGLDELQTMLGVESSWRNARANLTSARVQALRRAVQVYKALGGGWTPPPVTSR